MASSMSFREAAREVAFSGGGSKGIACINWVRYGLMVVASGALIIGIAVSAGAARMLVQRRKAARRKMLK